MRKRGGWFNLGLLAVLAMALFTVGCDDSDSTVDPNVTVSGFVVDGPIVGVHVEVVDADGNIYRSSDPTDERGWYAVKVSRGANGPLRVRTAGTDGNFNAVYHSILKMGKIENDRSDVHLTPMTTLVYFTSVTLAGGDDADITEENVDAATVRVNALFAQLDLGFDLLSTTPVATGDMDDDDLTAVLSCRTAISALLGALDGDDDDEDDEEFGMSGAFPAAASALARDLHDGAPAVSVFKTRLVRAFSVARVETLAAIIRQEAETLFGITIDLTVAVVRVTEKADQPVGPIALDVQRLGTYATGVFDEGAAEIAAYDPGTKRLFVVNGYEGGIDVLDASQPAAPVLDFFIDIAPYGKGANSVAFHDGVLAAAVENEDKQADGKVVFFDADGHFLNSVPAGALPDMVAFTPDGRRVLVANEGEPNDDYTDDPEGSVTIVDLSGGVMNATATNVGFTAFNDQADALKAAGVRIFGPDATVAQDVEPEYIAITPDSKTAWICLQENNALAELDIESATVRRILPFGFKDHSQPGNGMDASNRDDKIDIRPRPVLGMYLPDAIAAFQVGGTTYIATANEGDSREYDGFDEEARVADLTLDPAAFPNAASLQDDAELGRLKTTTTLGDTDGDGDVDVIYAYGGRSFSIWTPTDAGLTRVYDSGDDFERITAQKMPSLFNATNDENEADDRSDDKGPEPEGIEIGEINGHRIAFIGLERIGGIMIYDITDPTAPQFIEYLNHRDPDGDPETGGAGDLGPEGIQFIPAGDSPTDCPLLAVANEVSGTTTFYGINCGDMPAAFTLNVVHVNDTHSHLDPTEDSLYFDGVETDLEMGGYARLATEAAGVRAANPNTLVLHAGDAVQGTLYFTRYDGVADLDLLNRVGFDAMAVGNHEFDRGPEFLAGFINGADFPLLGANIDASADANLSGKIAPYAIETLNGEKVGIIGLITPETQNISSPGDNVVFLDQATAAMDAIDDLEAQGVNKIIVLSHMGFDLDQALARTVDGIDIIVGGHSHTLLGDIEDLGKSPAGDYPVEIEGPNGDTIYIVHSWEWAKAVGGFQATFDPDGRVIAFDGAAAFLVGDEFYQEDADGEMAPVDDNTRADILAAIAAHPAVKVVAEDPALLAALAPYAEGIDDLQTEVIATVSDDLLHIREPGQHTSGADLSDGSLIAPIVSEGMLWKANDVGLDADMALQNAGGVRIDIPEGDLTVGTAYELLPFGNTMVALDLTGTEIKAALENGVERSSGAWPYVAGARYTVDVSRPEGRKIVSVEILMDGAWVALDETATYRIVTNSYIAGGGDGYSMLAEAAGYRYDTGFVDAEVFMAYAEHVGTLTPPQTTYIVYMDGGASAAPTFAVFSDPHYFDPDLLINDGAAFQEYLARDRKLLKESEAILASTVDSIQNMAGLDFVLVPGDLTKDGEKTSHQKFADHIQTLENAGIPVYVVPGNHDIDNPHAHAYDGDAAIEVDGVSPTEFAQIYNDYGYGEAVARDPASLSYVAEPVPGLWLLALDSCRYTENDAAGKAVTGGRFSGETLTWITDRLAEAETAGKRVVAMMHHGLLEHFTGQSQANPGSEYVIENWETVSQTLAEAGLPVVFTGHFHAQDVAVNTWEVNGETIALTDVQTGSLVTYPNPYRVIDMNADGTLDIDSRYITDVDYDTGFMTFPEYAENYLLEGLNGLVYASLTMPVDQGGYGLPAEQANGLTPMIVAAFAAHYAGNESPDAETMAAINDMLASSDPTTKSLGQSLYALWTDPTPDLDVILHPDTGEVVSGESPIHQYRLVWTDNPATTMTVGFGQMAGADPYIKYGTTADLTDAMTQETVASTTYVNPRDGGDPDKVLESHFAELTGLTPDTAYHFQVCNTAGCGGTYWFKTAPDAPADFTFVAGGDTRTNATPRHHGNMLIARIRPLFIAHGGDYMNDGTYDEWVQWLDEWQSTISEDGRMYPVLPCHGNHENDVTDMMAQIFNIPNPDAYYAMNIAGDMMRLYTLNTELEPGVGYGAFDGQDETKWNQQADWFSGDIANYRDSVTWLVANYHRPLRPHTSGKSEGTGRIAAWADAFYDNGLDLAVECDTHMVKYTYPLKPSDGQCSYQDFARDDATGTVFVGEGSWGAPTRPTDDDKPWTLDSDSFWQFKLIHASPDALDIRTVKFGSQEDAADGIVYDPSTVTALTQAEQDADPFAMPAGLDLWQPLAGEVLTLPFSGADTEKTPYVCTGSEWRYRDDGAMPSAGWTAAGFDDSGWAAGAAQLGYGDGDETTVIDFGGDEDNKHLAYHFRKTFQVADPAQVIRLELSLLRDDGAVVYLNGREVLRDNMPDGAIDAGTTAVGAIGGGDESAFSRFPLNPDILVAGTNVIAVSVHQADPTSSDVSFDLDLTGLESRVAGTPPAAPADLTATPLSISDIALTWTDAATDEVGYELQRKVGDGAWEIHAPRLDADTDAFTDILLAEGQAYAYRVRAFNAAGLSAYSAEVETATLTNPTPVIYSEDFESGVLDAGRMFAVSVASDHDWEAAEYGGNHHAYMNGYGADAASDDWLIGGPFNLNFYSDESLAFDSAYNYDGPALEVKVSTAYDPAVHADPNSATWQELTPTLPAEGNYTFVNSGEVDLSVIGGDAVFVAFRYVSTGTGGGDGRAWEVDNVALRGNYDPPVLASADFDSGVISADMTYSSASDADWQAESHGGQDGAFMNGYGADAASNDWLILHVPEITEADNAVFSFDWYYKYDGPALKAMISTDYGGPADDPTDAAVTWHPLTVDFTGDAETWYNTGEIDISEYVGTDVYVAIVYESTGTGGGDGRRWGVDNLKVTQGLPDSINVAFTAEPARVPTGETVGFTAQASGGTGPYTYSWAFGDGETGSGGTTSHAYAAAGLYTVELTVTDADGNEAMETKTDLVEVFVQTPYEIPTLTADLRVASFNAYLNRSSDGELEADLAAADDPQAQKVAEILQRVRPDVVLLNEFDTVLDGTAVDRFRTNYLAVSQNGATPITYAHYFLAPSNTGVPSGHDLNNDGTVGGPDDAFGYGAFEGQYGMVILSQYPILESEARTFQTFLWKDMPDALLPDDPDTPAADDWYSADELAVFRLSSKSHWDVPVDVNGNTVHLLASHPTPPVFDGDEDRNGTRNHDEIRFWADYATPGEGGYIYDDGGATGGLPADARFVILGDLNASPDEGDGIAGAMDQVLDAATVNETFVLVSPGGPENAPTNPYADSHTADWKMRADYVLPSDFGFDVVDGAVFWPATTQDLYYLVGPDVQSSDHRLVYLDLDIVN